jgi:CBS domain containing-hemolysin-like protein
MINDLLGRSYVWFDQYVDGQDLGSGFYACFQGMTTLRWLTFGLATAGVLLCLFVLLVNAAIESALTAINRMRLQSMIERHERRVIVIEQLLDRPNQVLSALNTLNTICLIVATALTITGIHQFNLYGFEVTVLVLILTFLVLTLVRTVPKGFALNDPEGIAVKFGGFVNVETAVAGWLVRLINGLSNAVLKLAKVPPIPANTVVTQEELTLLANVAEEDGVIQDEEREMIRSIFAFSDTIVREVMLPRLDIHGVALSSSLDEVLDIILKTGHSRLPVYNEDIDHIAGILYAKDLLRFLRHREDNTPFDLQKILRPVHYVPESKKVDELFSELQKKRVHIAIIIDEYGGTAGLVTIEDLLEEIVGEIQDEYDPETIAFERVSDDEVLVDARLNLGDVNDFFNTQWESENVDTIGGFLYDKLEKIPVVGDQLVINPLGELLTKEEAEAQTLPYFCLTVLSAQGQRLQQLRLERIVPQPAYEEPEAPQPEAPQPSTSQKRSKQRDTDRLKDKPNVSVPAGFGNKDVGEGDITPA